MNEPPRVYSLKSQSARSLAWLPILFMLDPVVNGTDTTLQLVVGALMVAQIVLAFSPRRGRRPFGLVDVVPSLFLLIAALALDSGWGGIISALIVLGLLLAILSTDGGWVRIESAGLMVRRGWREAFIDFSDLVDVGRARQSWWMRIPLLKVEPFVSIRTVVRPGWPLSGVFSRGLSFDMESEEGKEFVKELGPRIGS